MLQTVTLPTRFLLVESATGEGVESSAAKDETSLAENYGYKLWIRTYHLPLYWLITTIIDQVISQVNHASSFKEIWMILNGLYTETLMVRVLQLK